MVAVVDEGAEVEEEDVTMIAVGAVEIVTTTGAVRGATLGSTGAAAGPPPGTGRGAGVGPGGGEGAGVTASPGAGARRTEGFYSKDFSTQGLRDIELSFYVSVSFVKCSIL